MKKIIFFLTFILIMPLFLQINYANATYSTSAEIVIETSSNRVLYSKNIHNKMYPASTTKILTAICVIENCNLSDEVTVTKDTINIEGSSIYLEEGEKLTVRDLLYGLMLRSGNDCAETLAKYCSGSIDNFINLMNITSKKIGAIESNFCNPHGLNNDNHYTTAYDLAIISSYCMKNKDFREIVSTKSIDIPFTTRGYKRHLVNKNKMLNKEGYCGIKTGYTKKAGRCLVSCCNKNGMEIISVVLNCQEMWEKTNLIVDNAYSNFIKYKFFDSDDILCFVNKNNSEEKVGLYIKNDVIIPLTKNEKENLTITFDCPKIIDDNIKKDSEIGKINFFVKNNLIFTEKLYTII